MLSRMTLPSKVVTPNSKSTTPKLPKRADLKYPSPYPLGPLDDGDTRNIKQLLDEDERKLAELRKIKSAPFLRHINSPKKQHMEDIVGMDDDELSNEKRITVGKFRRIMHKSMKSYDVDGIADDLESDEHPGMISLKSIPRYTKKVQTLGTEHLRELRK